MPPAGFEYGEIAGNAAFVLKSYVKTHRLGSVVGAETGFILARTPDTVRGADAAFVSAERVARQKNKEKFFDGPPDLAVEVVSPNDKDVEVEEKILDYLQAGTRLLWIVYPRTQTIYVYRSLEDVQILTIEDTLEGYNVLPGFSVPVREIFE
jgi:Uma2 family endonuclease